MRGRIISEDEGKVELLDMQGSTRTFYKRPGGFYLGENSRLYVKEVIGGDGRQSPEQKEVQFLSLGPASSSDLQEYRIEKNQRTVKDRMAGDHLRYLYKDQDMTLAEIGQKYCVSATYILTLLREYDIAGRPPCRRSSPDVAPDKPRDYQRQVTLQRIAQALLDNPDRANKWIAQELDSDHRTVQSLRTQLEEKGHIPRVEKVLGRDGKRYSVNRHQ